MTGSPVPQDPGLGTDLFVDFRDLIEAPQFAGYDIYEALLTGNSATIDAALQAGLTQIDAALSQFPVEVFDDSSPPSGAASDATTSLPCRRIALGGNAFHRPGSRLGRRRVDRAGFRPAR